MSERTVAAEAMAFRQAIARRRGFVGGSRDKRVSVRPERALLEAAKDSAGVTSDSEVIRLALTVLAVPDNFGEWLLAQHGRLDDDFTLDR